MDFLTVMHVQICCLQNNHQTTRYVIAYDTASLQPGAHACFSRCKKTKHQGMYDKEDVKQDEALHITMK